MKSSAHVCKWLAVAATDIKTHIYTSDSRDMRHLVDISVLDINFSPYIANNNKLHLAPVDMLLLKRDI